MAEGYGKMKQHPVYIFVDVETTGLDPSRHSVVQIAALAVCKGKIVEEFNAFCQPNEGREIDQRALQVNGFTAEKLFSFEEHVVVAKKFFDFLDKYAVQKYPEQLIFCGWNARFDFNFIMSFLDLNHYSHVKIYFDEDYLDIKQFAVQEVNLPHYRLGEVAKKLGLSVSENELHDGIYDIRLTYQIAQLVCQDRIS